MVIKCFENEKYVYCDLGDISLSYRLFKCPHTSGETFFALCISLYENGRLEDEVFVFDIAANGSDAEKIFDIVCKSRVTPYSFDECIDAAFDIL